MLRVAEAENSILQKDAASLGTWFPMFKGIESLHLQESKSSED